MEVTEAAAAADRALQRLARRKREVEDRDFYFIVDPLLWME
jgi:hypothetical protein